MQTSLSQIRVRLCSSENNASVIPLKWAQWHTVSKYTLTSPYVCREVTNAINLNQKHKDTKGVIYSSKFRVGICGRDCSWLWDHPLSLWRPAEEQSVFCKASVVHHLNISIVLPGAFLNFRNIYHVRVSSSWFSSRKNNLTQLNCKY